MFKIGDRVVRIGPDATVYGVTKGNIYTVVGFYCGDIRLQGVDMSWDPKFFQLASSPIDEAKATLEAGWLFHRT